MRGAKGEEEWLEQFPPFPPKILRREGKRNSRVNFLISKKGRKQTSDPIIALVGSTWRKGEIAARSDLFAHRERERLQPPFDTLTPKKKKSFPAKRKNTNWVESAHPKLRGKTGLAKGEKRKCNRQMWVKGEGDDLPRKKGVADYWRPTCRVCGKTCPSRLRTKAGEKEGNSCRSPTSSEKKKDVRSRVLSRGSGKEKKGRAPVSKMI